MLQDPVPKAVFASYYFAQAGGSIEIESSIHKWIKKADRTLIATSLQVIKIAVLMDFPTITWNKLISMPYFTRLIKMDRVGVEPRT